MELWGQGTGVLEYRGNGVMEKKEHRSNGVLEYRRNGIITVKIKLGNFNDLITE
jgi:hypothetical protein